MKIKTVTVPQGAAVSNFFDTEGLPIVGIRKTVGALDGTTEFALQTLAPGQDLSNPAAIWIPVLEPGVGARDTDGAGANSAENNTLVHRILANVFDGAGTDGHLYMYATPNVPRVGFAATDVTATSMGEAEGQALSNAFAYLINRLPTPPLPSILRVNLTNNQTTAAVTFEIYLAEPQRFAPKTSPRRLDVIIPNGDADSGFVELAPGERIVGIATPAAFTTATLTFQTVKNGLDPSISTDANWLNLVNAVNMRAAGAPSNIWQWLSAAQGQYMAVPEFSVFLELPRFLRIHGSANQAAQRTVTLFIQ